MPALRLLRTTLTLLAVSASCGTLAADLPTIELMITNQRATAEVAATTPTRTTGLMNRFSLKPDGGMLFVFNAPSQQLFWMKDTYVPLSIAFIDANGRILNIEDMAPQTETTHPSNGLALYALEMKKGWFAARGIGPGDRVDGLAKAPKAKE